MCSVLPGAGITLLLWLPASAVFARTNPPGTPKSSARIDWHLS
jgi:hypothetical protein